MYDEYGERGYVPLAVNLWQDMEGVVKYYAQQYSYPFFRDAGAGWSAYRMNGYIPLNYVIDTAGIVVGSMEGFNEATIRSWIEPYLTGVAESKNRQLPRFTNISPNPANRTQQIGFSLPRASNVSLRVYSATGELVRTILNRSLAAGTQFVSWNLTDDRGRFVPDGLYFYELVAGEYHIQMKVSVLR